jgi:hypothetical protein
MILVRLQGIEPCGCKHNRVTAGALSIWVYKRKMVRVVGFEPTAFPRPKRGAIDQAMRHSEK